MFPYGLPRDYGGHDRVNLMVAYIQRIRSGHVDLKPRPDDGWYQYQVYALETLLLPTAGPEGDKLLLTAEYKKRLMQAFQAIVTKQRETHVRQLHLPAAAPPPALVAPRLRVEPCPTFYLRTARSYAFLRNFLDSAVGRQPLAKLHGLRQGGQREASLGDELDAFARRFYGFYLLSCEDIGMRPQFRAGEPVDQAAARQAALEWLAHPEADPVLACDTRVAVPIAVDPGPRATRLWADFGVRLAHLEATYAAPPSLRLKGNGRGEWKEVSPYETSPARWVIAVDEFAEFELPSLTVPSRQELRGLRSLSQQGRGHPPLYGTVGRNHDVRFNFGRREPGGRSGRRGR